MNENERMIPEDGKNPYTDHPGFDAGNCELRITVTSTVSGYVRGGFACEVTGGHCLPDKHCERRRSRAVEQDKFLAMVQAH